MMTKKMCAHCCNFLPTDRFSSDSRSPDKLKYVCKDCFNWRQREYRHEKNTPFKKGWSDHSNDTQYKIAQCEICEKDFFPDKRSNVRCKQCTPIAQAMYTKLSRMTTRSKRIRENHNNKSYVSVDRIDLVSITRKFIRATACSYCSRDFSLQIEKTIDHIIPKCEGGKSTADNINICCRPCNMSKGQLNLNDWFDLCQMVLHSRK
jgi:5-methylcytosine-specific restriction endonuclease McrA